MNTPTFNRTHVKWGAALGALLLFIGGMLWLDGDGGSAAAGNAGSHGASKSAQANADPCSFLSTEEIEAATGIAGMTGHDKGLSAGTGSPLCKYDQGTGRLPSLTVYAHPTRTSSGTYLDFARENYKGADVAGIGDGAYASGGWIWVQDGGVTIEISAMVMNGYLPARIEGEPLVELARKALEQPSAS